MTSPYEIEDRQAQFRQRTRKAAEKAQGLANAYRTCFESEAGKKVLEDLRHCYGGSTVGHSPRKTEIHSAQRDVLLRIEDLISLAREPADGVVAELARSDDVLSSLLNPWSRYER